MSVKNQAAGFHSIRRLSIGLLLPFAIPAYAGEPVDLALDFVERYEAYGLSGAFLVARGDTVIFEAAVGLADRNNGAANSIDTYFDIASITKTITGAAILQLEARGKLDTSATLDEYLGPFPADKADATVHHLATHKAGLVIRGTDITATTREQFLDNVKQASREAAPGAEYRYTNAGYSLLAAVIESASGSDYETYVRQQLLEPAGAGGMRFVDELDDTSMPVARGYDGTHAEITVDAVSPVVWGDRGAGSVYARVHDVYNWVSSLYRSKVLPPGYDKRLFDASENEAYGWHDQVINGRRLLHKGGQTNWFASQVLIYPAEDLVIIWALNDNRQRWRTLLNRGLSAIFLREDVLMPLPVARDDDMRLAVTGRYTTSRDEPIRFVESQDADGIYVDGDTDCLPRNVLLLPASENRMSGFDGRDGSPVLLYVDSKGAAIRSEWLGETPVYCHYSKR